MILFFPLAALAADPEPIPVKLDGQLFARFSYDLSEGMKGYNTFEIDRAMLGARKEFGPHFAARILLDATREVDDPRDWIYLKNAFGEYTVNEGGPQIQFGMVPTPLIGFEDRFWGMRFASKSFADNNGVLSLADLGVGAKGSHSKGMVDWHIVAINGEGYTKPEVDKTKTFQGRLTVDPLSRGEKMNLPITGFASYATAPESGDSTFTWVGELGFKMDWFVATAEYLQSSTGKNTAGGYSAMVMPRSPSLGALYFRYDHFDPSDQAEKDSTDHVIGGVAHEVRKGVTVAVQYDRIMPEATPDTPSHQVSARAAVVF